MKHLAIASLLMIMCGCSAPSSDQTRITALQAQVNKLAQEVATLRKESSAVAALDLQSKCANDAKRTFDLLGWSKKPSAGFQSHYNQALHRCLMLIESTSTEVPSFVHDAILMDANEQRVYGSFTKGSGSAAALDHCEIDLSITSKSLCSSEDEFNRFAARFLE